MKQEQRVDEDCADEIT